MSEAQQIGETTVEQGRLSDLAPGERRRLGITYTPRAVADMVLDQEFGPGNGPVGPVLDPSCGTGIFLTALIERVATCLERRGHDIVSADRGLFLTAIEDFVWGVDTDEVALRIALLEARGATTRLSPGPLPRGFLRANLAHGDFLDETLPISDPPPFRHVIGNPPYVPVSRIPRQARARVREQYSAAFGRFDLYTLFIERSMSVVEPGGSWTFITPDKYLTSQSARPLRALLTTRGHVSRLTTFDSHQVFGDVALVPCITSWTDGAASESTDVRSAAPSAQGRYETVARGAISSPGFRDGSWGSRGRGHLNVLDALWRQPCKLGDFTTRISAGPATGLNAAFVMTAEEASHVEPELVHRAVRGRDIGAGTINDRGEFLLVPYIWTGDEAELVDIHRYPRAEARLLAHRAALESRHCVRTWGKLWWDFHDPVNLPLHVMSKVLVPDVAKNSRFAVDDGRFIPQHSAYYLLPRPGTDPTLLTRVLNSDFAQLALRASAPMVKDGYIRHRRQFLEQIPMPDLSDLGWSASDLPSDPEELDARWAELWQADPHAVRDALADTYPRATS